MVFYINSVFYKLLIPGTVCKDERQTFYSIPMLSGVENRTLKRGRFIVFEGLDRSGKTTQSHRLLEALNGCNGGSAIWLRFPERTTPIGKILNQYLLGDSNTTERKSEEHRVTHLLFAANRWERIGDINRYLQQGTHVISDRYSYSGVGFSSALGLAEEWCWGSERGLPKPDIVFIQTVPAANLQKREGFGKEITETDEIQTRVKQFYDKQIKQDPLIWKQIDGSRDVDAIHASFLKSTLDLISELPKPLVFF